MFWIPSHLWIPFKNQTQKTQFWDVSIFGSTYPAVVAWFVRALTFSRKFASANGGSNPARDTKMFSIIWLLMQPLYDPPAYLDTFLWCTI